MQVFQNHLLCDVSDATRAVLAEHLSPAPLAVGTILHAQGDEQGGCYFIEAGVVSLVRLLADGSRIEASLVGREGMVGSLAGAIPAFTEAEVQAPGQALRIEPARLMNLAAVHRDLADVLARYQQYLLDEARLNAVCNASHGIDQRLAKWLLRCHDRIDGDKLNLTQEFVSDMLGVQRTSITASLQRLAAAGAVSTGRSRVSVLSVDALRAISCECYEQIAERLPELGLLEAADRTECPT